MATFATVRDVYADTPEGASLYGLFASMLAFVPALGPVLGALLAGAVGWRAIFVLLGVLGTIAGLRAVRHWHETRPQCHDGARPAARRILGSGAFWVYTLGFSAGMGTFFVFFSVAPRLLVGRMQYSPLSFSLAFATVALVMIVTARMANAGIGRWNVRGTFLRGLWVMVAGALLMASAAAWRPSLIGVVLP
ncbi:MFS transporter, partial [Stenotrophomonas maltophilia]|uniref:MFS transporter n=1 Tax=Stenotrophomonas maltophilia TaxID=40324 RepID=UPI003145107E